MSGSMVRMYRMPIAAAVAVMLAAPAPTQRSALPSALSTLEAGLWVLRDLDGPGRAIAPICLGHPLRLVRVEHRNVRCAPLVVGKDAASVTVHYTCGGGDYGQTVVRTETSRLAQIETQGIRGGLPFSYRAEARWSGRCKAK